MDETCQVRHRRWDCPRYRAGIRTRTRRGHHFRGAVICDVDLVRIEQLYTTQEARCIRERTAERHREVSQDRAAGIVRRELDLSEVIRSAP